MMNQAVNIVIPHKNPEIKTFSKEYLKYFGDSSTGMEQVTDQVASLSSVLVNDGIKSGEKMTINTESGDKTAINLQNGDKTAINKTPKTRIIEYLRTNGESSSKEIGEMLGLKSSRTKVYLSELEELSLIITKGANKNRRYLLKEDDSGEL